MASKKEVWRPQLGQVVLAYVPMAMGYETCPGVIVGGSKAAEKVAFANGTVLECKRSVLRPTSPEQRKGMPEIVGLAPVRLRLLAGVLEQLALSGTDESVDVVQVLNAWTSLLEDMANELDLPTTPGKHGIRPESDRRVLASGRLRDMAMTAKNMTADVEGKSMRDLLCHLCGMLREVANELSPKATATEVLASMKPYKTPPSESLGMRR
jgi:hypothetical protein